MKASFLLSLALLVGGCGRVFFDRRDPEASDGGPKAADAQVASDGSAPADAASGDAAAPADAASGDAAAPADAASGDAAADTGIADAGATDAAVMDGGAICPSGSVPVTMSPIDLTALDSDVDGFLARCNTTATCILAVSAYNISPCANDVSEATDLFNEVVPGVQERRPGARVQDANALSLTEPGMDPAFRAALETFFASPLVDLTSDEMSNRCGPNCEQEDELNELLDATGQTFVVLDLRRTIEDP